MVKSVSSIDEFAFASSVRKKSAGTCFAQLKIGFVLSHPKQGEPFSRDFGTKSMMRQLSQTVSTRAAASTPSSKANARHTRGLISGVAVSKRILDSCKWNRFPVLQSQGEYWIHANGVAMHQH